MRNKLYNRNKVVEYAQTWAHSRNPQYYDFDAVGGDCTNFASQCIYAGSGMMNYNKNNGWYYINGNNKSPSWTGVEFLNKFITNNKSVGPFGRISTIEEIEPGDLIQLSFNGETFAHTLVIVDILGTNEPHNIVIAAHTDNSLNRRLSSYNFQKARFIKIDGVNIW